MGSDLDLALTPALNKIKNRMGCPIRFFYSSIWMRQNQSGFVSFFSRNCEKMREGFPASCNIPWGLLGAVLFQIGIDFCQYRVINDLVAVDFPVVQIGFDLFQGDDGMDRHP